MNKFYRIESVLDGGIPKHRKKSGPLPLAGSWLDPGVTGPCARMTGDREDLDITLPNSPAQKSFTNTDGFQMFGGTFVNFLNDAFKRRDVSLVGCVLVGR